MFTLESVIKFSIFPKIWEGMMCKFREVSGKCQNYRFFNIFWDIFDKWKGNLGQECVKKEALSFQGKIGTIALDFSGKMTIFQVFALLFNLSLPKIWASYPYKKLYF